MIRLARRPFARSFHSGRFAANSGVNGRNFIAQANGRATATAPHASAMGGGSTRAHAHMRTREIDPQTRSQTQTQTQTETEQSGADARQFVEWTGRGQLTTHPPLTSSAAVITAASCACTHIRTETDTVSEEWPALRVSLAFVCVSAVQCSAYLRLRRRTLRRPPLRLRRRSRAGVCECDTQSSSAPV
jgi:hypothetical protein